MTIVAIPLVSSTAPGTRGRKSVSSLVVVEESKWSSFTHRAEMGEKKAVAIPDVVRGVDDMERSTETPKNYNVKVMPPAAGERVEKHFDSAKVPHVLGYETGNYLVLYNTHLSSMESETTKDTISRNEVAKKVTGAIFASPCVLLGDHINDMTIVVIKSNTKIT